MSNVDYSSDIRKYAQSVDTSAVAGIVKYLGIAVKGRDGSVVACSDKGERDRVRDHFLKKKLSLANPDAELDKAIMDVCQTMAKDHNKHRVTFYYLLAERYGKLAELDASTHQAD